MELLEREPHLDQLAEHLRQAAAGHGRVVLVGGEAGVGKSTLVDAFCRRVADGAEVLRTSCDALSTPGPLGCRARPCSRARPPDRLRRPSTARRGTGSSGRCWRPSPRDPGRRSSSPKMPTGPTVPRSSCCASSAGGSADLPVLVVVTYRDDEIGADHPLRLVLGDLATAPAVHRIGVRPLSEAAVQRLAAGSGRDAATLTG